MTEHPLATFGKLDPKMLDHIHEINDLIYGPGALPRKIKLLMAMAFDAAYGAAQGVRALAEQALSEGATREEIAETLRVAYHLAGIGALYTASAGLKDII